MQKVLITGTAGFIGFHLAKKMLANGFEVVGIDNINNYYDVNLKYARLAETGIYAAGETDHTGGKNRKYKEIDFDKEITSVTHPGYRFIRMNLEKKEDILNLFKKEKFEYVIHLAAQAGVRYSIENPDAYISSNITGFFNILEACRFFPVTRLIYASSSSVYGENAKVPFSVEDKVDAPVSLYAATKKSNELMAYTYSHLYKIPVTGLRFFTVYGEWGRPDMAPCLFANAISKGDSIKVFNNGNMERDFTYIHDITEAILKLVQKKDPAQHLYQLHNIGNGKPVNLLEFIETLEKAFGSKAEKIFLPMQPGDVKKTWADTSTLEILTSYKPKVHLSEGITSFVTWFKNFYNYN
ncbi:MAG TPA: NAD-dependent epimerase/dehydratase family protein [Chitinophagaceae bacterium]|nr:NAD-dependent epimerase/dehydratase family protein [Chitinophagaceae bacterium]